MVTHITVLLLACTDAGRTLGLARRQSAPTSVGERLYPVRRPASCGNRVLLVITIEEQAPSTRPNRSPAQGRHTAHCPCGWTHDRLRPGLDRGPGPHRPAKRSGCLGVEPVRICLAHRPDWDHPARPGLREALAACRSGSMLVVIKLDRLSRSLPDVRDFGGLGGQLECNPAHPRGGRRGRDGAVQLARAWGAQVIGTASGGESRVRGESGCNAGGLRGRAHRTARAAATAVRTPRWTRPSGRPYETRSPLDRPGPRQEQDRHAG